jgi:hypothetical protein
MGPKPKHLRIEQVYSLLYYDEKIKPEFKKELQAQHNKQQGDDVAKRASITKMLYDSEDDEVQRRVADERERLYQEATTKWLNSQAQENSVEQQQEYVFSLPG